MPGLTRKVKVRKSADTSGIAAQRDQAQAVRPRQEFVLQRRVEDRRRDGARVQVGDLRRVEAGLGDAEGAAQDLRRAGVAAARSGRPASELPARPSAAWIRRRLCVISITPDRPVYVRSAGAVVTWNTPLVALQALDRPADEERVIRAHDEVVVEFDEHVLPPLHGDDLGARAVERLAAPRMRAGQGAGARGG